MLLKDGDKRSDVYSLGRIINFLMTNDPNNSHHFLRSVAEKATNPNPSYRYADAGQLLSFVEQRIQHHEAGVNTERINQNISQNIYDEEVESYIYEMSGEKLCELLKAGGNLEIFLEFMRRSDNQASHIIQSIEDNYQEVCGRTYESYDPFASLSYRVLIGDFSYIVKELAATILRYIAYDVNRFSAQHQVERAINNGLEPLIEDILQR